MRADLEERAQKYVSTTAKNAPQQKSNNFMFHDPSITALNVKTIDVDNIKPNKAENSHLKGIDDFNNLKGLKNNSAIRDK